MKLIRHIRSGPPKPAPANCLKIFRSISAISIYRTVYGSCMYEWEVSSTRVVSPYMIQSTRHKFCTLSLNLDFQEFLYQTLSYPDILHDILHAVISYMQWTCWFHGESTLVLGTSTDRRYQIRVIVSVWGMLCFITPLIHVSISNHRWHGKQYLHMNTKEAL